MDKRSTRILIGCILCTMIVLALFLIVFRFTQLSCELVSLDPLQLASSQLAAFSKDSNKPIRSHDETIVMKISAYLEYNIQPDLGESPSTPSPPFGRLGVARAADAELATAPIHSSGSNGNISTGNNNNLNTTTSNSFNQQPTGGSSHGSSVAPQSQPQANKSSPAGARSSQLGPAPSSPQLAFNGQQQQLQPNGSSTNIVPQANQWDSANQFQQQQQHHHHNNNKAEKRFLPLELRSIEARNLQDGVKHKYILNFNCTKLSMVLVHQNNRVYVESMNLELRPAIRQEATCELQLPPTGAFMVADSTGGLAASGPASQLQQQQQSTGPVAPAGFVQAASVAVNGTVTGSGAQFRDSSTSGGKHTPSAHSSKKEYPHFAHYYCNKPLRYSCYHYNSKSGPSQTNGLLLAELHINGIEFETSTSWMGKHKKVKSEFKSKRSECNII